MALTRNPRRSICAIACLILGALPASSVTISYSDRLLWESASSALTLVQFTGLTGSYSNADGLSVGAVNFLGHSTSPFGYELQVTSATDWGSGEYLQGPAMYQSGFSRIAVSLPSGVTAVGSDIMTRDAVAGSFLVRLNGAGTLYSAPTLAGTASRAFIGFTSDAAITMIEFFPQDPNQGILDNFAYGAAGAPAAETPETASLILGGTGLLFLLLKRRRRLLPAGC